MRILFVEDDARTAEYVSRGFAEAGHVADVIRDGRDALVHGMNERFDVMVIDRMLPGPRRAVAGQGPARLRQYHAGAVPDRRRRRR